MLLPTTRKKFTLFLIKSPYLFSFFKIKYRISLPVIFMLQLLSISSAYLLSLKSHFQY